MAKTAVVEKTDDGGYIINFGGVKRVAVDEEMLAKKFESWPEPEERIEPTAEGLKYLEAVGAVVRGDAVEEPGTARGERGEPAEWPSVPTAPDLAREVTAAELLGASGPDEVTRAPIADDGYEYPPVRQEGANHFVITCPNHGEQRMTRNGADWVCAGKTNKQACGVAIPSTQMRRALRKAA